MNQTCALCGKKFQPRSKRAKFCSAQCRNKSHYAGKSGKPVVVKLPTPNAADIELEVSALADAVAARVADHIESVEAQAALVLARRIEQEISGAAIAALVRELRVTLAALAPVAEEENPFERLRRQREERATPTG